MKHIFFLSLVFSILSSFTFSSGTPKHGPILVIDTSNSNFGAVPNKGFAERSFVLSNSGDSVLHITQVRPTCGCTIAALTDSLIAPGHSTNLKIRLSAENASLRNFSKEIFIVSNSRADSVQWLKFYGHFVAANRPSAQKKDVFLAAPNSITIIDEDIPA